MLMRQLRAAPVCRAVHRSQQQRENTMAVGDTHTAFVYGTLLADEVLVKLLGRAPEGVEATLYGFSRHRIKGVVYPAIIPSGPESSVKGKVLLALTQRELDILDTYEAEEYYRETVDTVLQDGSKMAADVYIWRDEYRPRLLTEEWDYDLWRQTNLHKWVGELEPQAAHPTGATE